MPDEQDDYSPQWLFAALILCIVAIATVIKIWGPFK